MEKTQLEIINDEIKTQLANVEVRNALLTTVFKGLPEPKMREAILEGMIRGFTFKQFLEKDIYAIPFKNGKGEVGYSLVTSIDRARKIAMSSGLAGKTAPKYTYNEKKEIESCTVTVKRLVDGLIGDYTATVFFSEYFKAGFGTWKSLWETKPHTMIAKVAEMHALRSAFPEKMAQEYIAEEFEKGNDPVEALTEEQNAEFEQKLRACTDLKQLQTVFASFPPLAMSKFRALAEELKKNYHADTKI